LQNLKIYVYCNGKWHIKSSGWGQDTANLCPAFTGEKIIERVEENNTENYINKTFDNFNETDNEINKIKSFLKSEKIKNLLLKGTTGTGKTHLAKATELYSMINSKHVEFIMAPELYHIFLESETWNKDYEEKNNAKQSLSSFEHAEILIIDDLGCKKETKNKFFSTNLLLLLEKRKKGKLIITTNLNIADNESFIKMKNKEGYLNSIYEPRIISRLLEKCQKISLVGIDNRLK